MVPGDRGKDLEVMQEKGTFFFVYYYNHTLLLGFKMTVGRLATAAVRKSRTSWGLLYRWWYIIKGIGRSKKGGGIT